MYHSIDHVILKVSGGPVNTQINSVLKGHNLIVFFKRQKLSYLFSHKNCCFFIFFLIFSDLFYFIATYLQFRFPSIETSNLFISCAKCILQLNFHYRVCLFEIPHVIKESFKKKEISKHQSACSLIFRDIYHFHK